MAAATILKNTRRDATIYFLSTNATTGNVTANLAYGPANLIFKASNGDNFQTFVEASASAPISGLDYSSNETITIERIFSNSDRTTVMKLAPGQGSFDFIGYELNQQANANIMVNFGTAQGFVAMKVKKNAGFVDPDTNNLQARDRGPF